MPANAEDDRCSFCVAIACGARRARKDNLVAVIPDANPVTEGHHLVVPVRHVADFFEMTAVEIRAAYAALHDLRERLCAADPEIAGFNVGANSGDRRHITGRRQRLVHSPQCVHEDAVSVGAFRAATAPSSTRRTCRLNTRLNGLVSAAHESRYNCQGTRTQ